MACNSVLGRICEEKEAVMGGSSRVLRASLGAVLLVGFTWFLFVGILANQATETNTITVLSTGNFNLLKFIGTEGRHAIHRDFALNYVSKRRVPNGPDPIHNRRAGKTRQPPGRA